MGKKYRASYELPKNIYLFNKRFVITSRGPLRKIIAFALPNNIYFSNKVKTFVMFMDMFDICRTI